MTDQAMKPHNSIRARYLRLIFILLAALAALSVLFFLYIENERENMIAQQHNLEKRTKIVNQLGDTLDLVVIRARGYYAFKNEFELVLLNESFDELEEQIEQFKALPLKKDEQKLAEELSSFYQQYRYTFVPRGIEYAEANDYESLSAMSLNESSDLVNGFLLRVNSYTNEHIDSMNRLHMDMLDQSAHYTNLAIILYGLVLLILVFAMWVSITRIVRPIEELDLATRQLADGKPVSLPVAQRKDEMGKLLGSFAKMAKALQRKEKELLAQNEELQAQQDELQEKQFMLQKSLTRLEQYNQLNHHLSYTLDEQKLVESIHQFLRRLFPFDKTLFWIENNEKSFASHGISMDTAKRVINGDGINLERLKQEQTYIVKRESNHTELGMAEEPFHVYDLYSGVFGSDGELLAVYCATRLGIPVSEEEREELDGILKRISLAIGRIDMYKQIEHSRKLNQNIVNNVNEGIQFVNPSGDIIQYNDTLREQLSITDWPDHRDIPFRNWIKTFMAVTAPKEELHHFFMEALANTGPEAMSFFYSIAGPDEKFMSVYASPVYGSGERIGTIFVHRDVTKEHEVDQMKSELVSTVSHELRTPLSSVLGFTELLLHKTLTQERQRKYLTTIHKEATRLTNLINDFLDIQRMESGKQQYDMEPCRVDELIMGVIQQFKHEKSHALSLVDRAPSVTVRGDKDRLTQVFMNLVSNAVKFSPNGGNVEITLKNEKQDLVISIRDEGLGISKDDIKNLFQKFKRIDNSERRKIGGTGLGLAITKEIVKKHQGEIWIESEEGKGTTVYVKLPLNDLRLETREILTGGETGRNVMIVEDDASIALLLSEELKGKGFQVIHHFNPEKAYEEAVKLPFVGIVVDLMLGEDMNGWDLIEKLAENEKTADIPIIISSALDKEEERVGRHRIAKYLTKPYSPEELSDFLQNHLQHGGGE